MATRLILNTGIFLGALALSGQSKITLDNADRMTVVQTDTASITYLVGDVKMHNEEGTFRCDSALWWRASERFDAFGDVVFLGQNGVKASSIKMRYEGGLLKMRQNVKLQHGSQTMNGPQLDYHTSDEHATFFGRSLIRQGTDSLFANQGQYDASLQVFRYQGDIQVLTQDFDVNCDELIHYSADEYMVIPHDGRAIRDSGFIQFGSGYINESENLAIFSDGVYGRDGQDWFQSANMWRNETADHLALSGRAQWKEYGSDGIEVYGDSLSVAADSVEGFGNISLFVQDISARSEQLHWNETEEVLTLRGQPELWMESYFIRCTELKLFRGPRDSIYLSGPVLVLERTEDSTLYHQMIGKEMTGWLNDQGPESLTIKGNATALYHADSERINVTKSSQIVMIFKEEDDAMVLETMTFVQSPEGKVNNEKEKQLEGFVDHFDAKPSRIDWISGLK